MKFQFSMQIQTEKKNHIFCSEIVGKFMIRLFCQKLRDFEAEITTVNTNLNHLLCLPTSHRLTENVQCIEQSNEIRFPKEKKK